MKIAYGKEGYEMKLSLYLNDYETEKIFSYLRWIFLIISFVLFYVPPFAELLGFDKRSFLYLVVFGILYMAAAQIALTKIKESEKTFQLLTKGGIVFDYIAFFWLMALTGGLKSPLFPIAFLLVIHSTIYWRTKGAFVSSIAVTIGYTAFFYSFYESTFINSFYFLMNLVFLWIIGVFGAMIVLRERVHLKEKEIIRSLLNHDYLTGLYNHRCFQDEIRIYNKSEEGYTLILADIDSFKEINDGFGHTAGDEVLQKLGNLFSELVETYDGKAFRYGGEEFAFLLPMGLEGSEDFFRDAFDRLNETYYSKEKCPITMSFGAAFGMEIQSVENVITKADKLLYEAKRRGKNCAVVENGTVYENQNCGGNEKGICS